MKTPTIMKMNPFHQGLIILFVLGFSLSTPTKTVAQNTNQSQARTTIVFVDKTVSVVPDSFIKNKNETWLIRIIRENIRESGDKIIISFIFENTSSATNQFEFVYREPRQRTGRMSSSEARIAKMKHDKRLRASKRSFTAKVMERAFSFEPSLAGTDVVGSIKLLSDVSKANSQQILKAYFFSDMQECSEFRYLFCGASQYALKSIDHALSLAKKDFPRIIQRYQLRDNSLKSFTEISIIFPAQELDADRAFALLPTYWSYIFSECGVSQIYYY